MSAQPNTETLEDIVMDYLGILSEEYDFDDQDELDDWWNKQVERIEVARWHQHILQDRDPGDETP